MRNLILPFLLILTLVFSCRSENDEVLVKNTSYDVYVAGRENNKACYWKNTIKTDLTNGDNISTLQIKVENNNVYVTGSTMANPAFNGIDYFWKNNVRTNVKQYLNIPGNAQSNITAFTVNNGDIYFAGYVENTTTTSALDRFELCYWKNGVKTILFKSQYISTAQSVFIDGSNVYVSTQKVDNNLNVEMGYYKNTIFNSITSDNVYNFAKSNNTVHLLIKKNSKYYSINLDSNSEIIMGDYVLPISGGKIISDLSTNDLYAIYFGDGIYYKNTTLVTPNFFQSYAIQDLFVIGNNIFMIKYGADNTYTAKVFINGVETQNISGAQNGRFTSIFVVQN